MKMLAMAELAEANRRKTTFGKTSVTPLDPSKNRLLFTPPQVRIAGIPAHLI